MKANELKINIIDQIIHSNNDDLMHELQLMLNLHNQTEYTIKLSPELKEAIKESEEQIVNGEFRESEIIWKTIDKWLDEK